MVCSSESCTFKTLVRPCNDGTKYLPKYQCGCIIDIGFLLKRPLQVESNWSINEHRKLSCGAPICFYSYPLNFGTHKSASSSVATYTLRGGRVILPGPSTAYVTSRYEYRGSFCVLGLLVFTTDAGVGMLVWGWSACRWTSVRSDSADTKDVEDISYSQQCFFSLNLS